jgi:ribonuclease R
MTRNSNQKNSKQNKRSSDPHADREASRYETPLPSRELILSSMSDQGIPLSVEQLYILMDISDDEREIFNKRLNAMEREGQIIKNRKGALCIADKLDLIAGVIQGHPDGFGFLIPDDKTKLNGEDLFLSPKEMSQVMHGDRAMVRMSGLDRRGRPEGKLVEVLERRTQKLVGRVMRTSGVTIVAAEDKRINQDILIPYHLDMDAKAGQVVMVELTEQPSSYAQPMGKVVEILGNYADSGMEIEIALRKHKLPYEFTKEAVQLAEAYPKLVQPADYKGRTDCREMPLITIDGETARDFDDAVYAEPQGKGWRLVVAIADVSFYVKPNDALDKGAFERGNSVYFPRRVIPMLPEALSNGLCSLNPEVERMCMICDMQVDGMGVVKQYKFYPSVMRSQARMTYTQVHEILQNPQGELAAEYTWLMPHLQHLQSVYKLMLSQREKRGAIEFESTETMMIFNDQGKIEQIVPVTRNEAHKLIEECMLAANVCAADFLKAHEHPALYRIHEGPTPEKLELLRAFMGEFGFGVGGGDTPHAKDYGKLIEKIKERPDAQLLQTVLLRSMMQAVYSPDNVGHFGLAYEAYAHFTSPIRRYPDLLIHRAIKAVLNGDKYKAGDWSALGVHCSMTERRADDATRDVTNWLKCFYMQDKIGEVFEGTVAGVTSFGLFVALDGVYVEGLLHVAELGNDYFHFDKARHEMTGERTGVRYRLGDRLTIKVVRVDLETTKIDFTLVNKNKSVEDDSNVDSIDENNKSGNSFKMRDREQSTVKSSAKFESAFGSKSNRGAKPALKAGTAKAGDGVANKSGGKSKTSGKLTLGSKSKPKSSNQKSNKNPPKPTTSKKASKKTAKR